MASKTAKKKPAQKPSAAPLSGVTGASRAVIDAVRPNVDAGRFPVKRTIHEALKAEADIFGDGHDKIGAVLQWRKKGESDWREQRLTESYNDLWLGGFTPDSIGAWEYRVTAWIDPFLTWAHDLGRRIEAGQDIQTDLLIGANLLKDAAASADKATADEISSWAARITGGASQAERGTLALHDDLADLMWRAAPRRFKTESAVMPLWVDRPLGQFGSWYEMFPRSASSKAGEHGTLRDVIDHLDYVSEMAFDILYIPPIHPIGRIARKGKNNTERAEEGDVGSCWAIGAKEGGHKSVHPDLGTLDDFDALVKAAKDRRLEIAMDIAFQCAPDHPYVEQHPEWFKHRPDGTIQYAENPPKKYQDIYPFDFECEDWEALWHELKSVFEFWIDRGITVFRVDNPHTKPFGFWEWVIGEIHDKHPEVIFLAEAFTKPKKMYRLAKAGYTQSYTYFAWRNGPADLREYVEELSTEPAIDCMRPNFWPNTPDILTEYLQTGGRTAAMARLVLAATLTPSYGIYGPVYELCDFTPRPGAEENIDSEKYEIRHWNRDDRWSLRHFIGLVNRIRRTHPALQQLRNTVFHHAENPAHMAYSKRSADGRDVILCIVNTNPHEEHWGRVWLDLDRLGVPSGSFRVHDLLTGIRWDWQGNEHMIGLKPGAAHIFHIESPEPGEHGFDGDA